MPPNDSFGFDDDQWFLPVAPETTKHDPEKTVFCSNLRPFLMTFPDGQLLAERTRWPTAGGAQGFPKPDRNPFETSKVCSKSVSATSSSWMQTLQACVKMSIISVRTEYLRATPA
jgi:hypothetical protein